MNMLGQPFAISVCWDQQAFPCLIFQTKKGKKVTLALSIPEAQALDGLRATLIGKSRRPIEEIKTIKLTGQFFFDQACKLTLHHGNGFQFTAELEEFEGQRAFQLIKAIGPAIPKPKTGLFHSKSGRLQPQQLNSLPILLVKAFA